MGGAKLKLREISENGWITSILHLKDHYRDNRELPVMITLVQSSWQGQFIDVCISALLRVKIQQSIALMPSSTSSQVLYEASRDVTSARSCQDGFRIYLPRTAMFGSSLTNRRLSRP